MIVLQQHWELEGYQPEEDTSFIKILYRKITSQTKNCNHVQDKYRILPKTASSAMESELLSPWSENLLRIPQARLD